MLYILRFVLVDGRRLSPVSSYHLPGPPVSVYDIGTVIETRQVPSTTAQPAPIIRMTYCYASSKSQVRQRTNLKSQKGDPITSIQPVVVKTYITIPELRIRRLNAKNASIRSWCARNYTALWTSTLFWRMRTRPRTLFHPVIM